MNRKTHIPCMILRGGTSKGVFFLENDLPAPGAVRDQLLLKVMGSPDPRQINGLGGGTSVTSKIAIVGASRHPDADVDYTFAQVSVDKPIVSYKGNCGNISSAVGPFAIERGLVKAVEPVTTVRIFNTNTNKMIEADVQIENGGVKYDGDYRIAGVKAPGAPIKLKFIHPAGTISPRLLPTGNVVDTLEVPGVGSLQASFVDAANPLVFVRASDVGLTGTELPKDIDGIPGLLDKLERIRGVAAVKIGLISDYTTSAQFAKVDLGSTASKLHDGRRAGNFFERYGPAGTDDVNAESASLLRNDWSHVYCSGSYCKGQYSVSADTISN